MLAIDQVGLQTQSSSAALTCDLSPPIVGSILIEGEEFGHVTELIKVSWENFEDAESGIQFYEWCIGSGPKFSDVIKCTETKDTFIDYSSNLHDGQIYYFTVKVIFA